MPKTKKTKIAFCMRDMQVGGAESVFCRIADALIATGKYDITLLTYVNISEPIYVEWLRARPEIKTFALYPCKFLGTRMPHFFLWRLIKHAMRDVYRGARRTMLNDKKFSDIDVFIDFYDFGFANELKKFNAPKIAWWHSSSRRFIQECWVRFVSGYDKIVSLTCDFVSDVGNKYPDIQNKITHIYNPIDVAQIRKMAENAARFDGNYFSCVSRISADKDIATVIRAFDKFMQCANNPDVKLIIVGDGALKGEMETLVKSLGQGNNIIFMGAMKNPFGIMGGACANILSSYNEGLAIVLIEAQALSVQNIASNCPNGPREILCDGKLGQLYPSGDADALAKCMMNVWRGQFKKPTARALNQSLDRFDMKNITPQIENLIKSVR